MKKKKKNNKGRLSLRIFKRASGTYYSIEEYVDGKNKHIISLPPLKTLIEIVSEWKHRQNSEKFTQENDLEFLE